MAGLLTCALAVALSDEAPRESTKKPQKWALGGRFACRPGFIFLPWFFLEMHSRLVEASSFLGASRFGVSTRAGAAR